jgi:hypothetical protein
METSSANVFAVPLPTLPAGVAVCEGIRRSSWITKAVILTNEAGIEVAKAICHSVDALLVIDMDGKPLGDDRVAVQIAESLSEVDVPSSWMWSMHSWHISRVYLKGASLFDHDQTHIFKTAASASTRRNRSGVRSYESSRERNEPDNPPRKEALLTAQAIAEVSTKVCCRQNCLQPFPRGEIQAIRSQLYIHGGVYNRQSCLLGVHKQIHHDPYGREMITLASREVCPSAWCVIHGIHKSTFYRYKEQTKNDKQPEHHGNVGLKKPRTHTVQATATLRLLLDNSADQMPHKSRTLQSGEKVPSMVLPSAFRWRDTLPEINSVNSSFQLQHVSASGLSNIRRASFPEYAPKARGDSFARCGECDTLKQLRSACTPGSRAQEVWTRKLKVHLAGQQAHRELYYGNRMMSEKWPEKMLTIIHDKMDHSKTASPHYSHKNKGTDSFMKMPVAVTGMIAHGHGDVRYAHYGLDIFPTDSNHTVGSIAKLLRDLESEPKASSRKLLVKDDLIHRLSKAILEGSEVCVDSLPPRPQGIIELQCLPPTLTLQLDNASGDNKNRWVFAFCSLLVYRAVFREIYINFLIVGHTHEDIDALFGRWSSMLKTHDYLTVPRLMKSFMDCETQPVIPHFIEEVPDFKGFVEGYLHTGDDSLQGHSQAQQFKFYKDSNGWPLMQYKILCTDIDWLPKEGGGIRLWKETSDGCPKVPRGSPSPLGPQLMRSFEEVCKGVDSYIALWGAMANQDLSGEFRRKIEPVKKYWEGVRSAFSEPLVRRETLRDGFWPNSIISIVEEDQYLDDGTMREEFAEDAPFVGRRRDRPRPSFRVGRDVYAGYFVAVRPADGDLRPFWLARALTNPNPDPGHVNSIHLQYWTPSSFQHIDEVTYFGWDTKQGNLWCEDKAINTSWTHTDCIMTAWKPRVRAGTSDPRIKIPKTQIAIIRASVEAYVSAEDNNEASS